MSGAAPTPVPFGHDGLNPGAEMDPNAFRKHGHELVDWIADYFEHVEQYPVLSRVEPGDIVAALPDRAPEDPEPFDAIMAAFERVIYDTASIATMHALVAAREASVDGVRRRGLTGRTDVPRVRVYGSDQTHSSIDKAAMAIGLGHESLRKIPTDGEYRMRVDLLRAAIAEDREAGMLPIAVIATVGT